jgi:hypothetical protein
MLDPRVMQSIVDKKVARAFRSLTSSPDLRGLVVGRRGEGAQSVWLLQDEHGKEHDLVPHEWELAEAEQQT